MSGGPGKADAVDLVGSGLRGDAHRGRHGAGQDPDTAGFDEYVRVVSRVIEKYGGRYVVRDEAVEVLEGEWKPKRLTVIEFPNKARAKEFYGSKEFREIVHLRHRSAKTNLILVEGVQ